MSINVRNPPAPLASQLRFASLFSPGRGFSFPCDDDGVVDLASLSAGERASYARAARLVGRELSFPAVEPAELH